VELTLTIALSFRIDDRGGRCPAKAIGISRDEIRCRAFEGYEASIGGDHGSESKVIRLRSTRVEIHSLGRAKQTVVNKHVVGSIGISGHEVGRSACECHEAAVGGYGQGVALAVSLYATGTHTRALGCAGLAIVNEDVRPAIRVAEDKIGSQAHEHNVVPVG
jgi:hypothetical protein